MADLTKWNRPWLDRTFSDFFESDRLFGFGDAHSTMPKVNVAENDQEYRIEVCVPGMSKKDIHVNVEDNRLILSGEKKEENKEDKEHYTLQEFRTSSFSRTFILPENADAENIEARFEEGILKLTLKKKLEDTTRKRKEIKIA